MMIVTRQRRFVAPAAFLAGTAVVYAVCLAILHSQKFAAKPAVGSFGIAFDLTITVSLLFYFLMVRSGRARPATTIPVFLISVSVAARIIPPQHHQFLRILQFAGAPLELLLIVLVVRRLSKLRREGFASADPVDRIQAVVSRIFGGGRVSEIAASEISLLYLGAFAWRSKADRSERAITFHEASGWGTILFAIFVMIAAEGVGMHLLLSMWSRRIAWLFTALDVYSIFWLLGDYQALRLRPTLIDESSLHLRFGLRWAIDVPLDRIDSVKRLGLGEFEKNRKTLRVAILEEPSYLVRLKEPVRARGFFGLTRDVEALALRPDDSRRFESLIAPAIAID